MPDQNFNPNPGQKVEILGNPLKEAKDKVQSLLKKITDYRGNFGSLKGMSVDIEELEDIRETFMSSKFQKVVDDRDNNTFVLLSGRLYTVIDNLKSLPNNYEDELFELNKILNTAKEVIEELQLE